MTIDLREARPSDIPFLARMHYEAVFWRAGVGKPPFEEGATIPGVSNAVRGWGERAGDTAVIAASASEAVGAACYRFWTDDEFINGYIDERTPVVVIGVRRAYRRQGIGKRMMGWLIDRASKQGLQRISLSVSKDNHALELYRQQGFIEYADKGDALLMVRPISREG